MVFDGKRYCYFIFESMKDEQGNYRPGIAVDGEPGYYVTDYDYGTDFMFAQMGVDKANEKIGVSVDDAMDIVATSMAAGSL